MPINPGKKIDRDDAAFYGDLYGRSISDARSSQYVFSTK